MSLSRLSRRKSMRGGGDILSAADLMDAEDDIEAEEALYEAVSSRVRQIREKPDTKPVPTEERPAAPEQPKDVPSTEPLPAVSIPMDAGVAEALVVSRTMRKLEPIIKSKGFERRTVAKTMGALQDRLDAMVKEVATRVAVEVSQRVATDVANKLAIEIA